MRYLNDIYHDRGMKKWAGFYLSDHTAKINNTNKERYKNNERKEQQTLEEIGFLLNESILKTKRVAVQLEAVNEENKYYDDIVGAVSGYDELGIYIDNQKVHYDEIRNIEIIDIEKWSNVSDD